MNEKSTSSSCVWKNQTNKQTATSLGTCWEATREPLHPHQHQSSHRDHPMDDRGGTRWWRNLPSAGLIRSHRLDSRTDPIPHTSTEAPQSSAKPIQSDLGLPWKVRSWTAPGWRDNISKSTETLIHIFPGKQLDGMQYIKIHWNPNTHIYYTLHMSWSVQ